MENISHLKMPLFVIHMYKRMTPWHLFIWKLVSDLRIGEFLEQSVAADRIFEINSSVFMPCRKQLLSKPLNGTRSWWIKTWSIVYFLLMWARCFCFAHLDWQYRSTTPPYSSLLQSQTSGGHTKHHLCFQGWHLKERFICVGVKLYINLI